MMALLTPEMQYKIFEEFERIDVLNDQTLRLIKKQNDLNATRALLREERFKFSVYHTIDEIERLY